MTTEVETGPGVAVRCRAVSKSYGAGTARIQALREADLDVLVGELLLLVGPSGSGKTTLLSVMTGLVAHDSGECRLFGRDVRGLVQDEGARFRAASIGFVFQTFNLLPGLTALENVTIPLLLNGRDRREAEARGRAALDRVSLGDRAGALPSSLSGGQQQRVAIARAVVHEPRLIVCDEPTSNLDHASGRSAMELLRDVGRRDDRAVVVVTHDPRVLSFADRVAEMEDGRVVALR